MSQSILGMDRADLGELIGPGQPEYRARQLYQALYREGAPDLIQIATLPSSVRARLAAGHEIGLPGVAAAVRLGRRHAAIPAAARGWPHRRDRPDAGG